MISWKGASKRVKDAIKAEFPNLKVKARQRTANGGMYRWMDITVTISPGSDEYGPTMTRIHVIAEELFPGDTFGHRHYSLDAGEGLREA